jgi:hypothetical protein
MSDPDYYTRGSRRFSLAVALFLSVTILILLVVGMVVSP